MTAPTDADRADPGLRAHDARVELSVVTPIYNEEANVGLLVQAIRSTLGNRYRWELLLVDDGSTDGTREAARAAARSDPRVRVVPLARNYGQTAAMQAGFDRSRGRVVVTMDGDLQNDPRDIRLLLDTLDEGYDLVAGRREDRKDRLVTRKVPSWVANRLIGLLTGVPIRDNGCSLKAYRRELLDGLHLYSEQHRFIPALAAAAVGARIAEIPVRHHPRRHGRSKYGLSRTWRVLLDLLTVTSLRWFRERPLVLFSSGALAAGLVGSLLLMVALVTLMGGAAGPSYYVIPGVVLLLFGLSFYLLMLGLIGEVTLKWRVRSLPVPGMAGHRPKRREA